MPQKFYTLLNFNLIMIYMVIHKMILLLKNQLNYLKNSIFKCFFKECNRLLFICLFIYLFIYCKVFHNI